MLIFASVADVQQYFIDQARGIFERAGGDPNRCGPLAMWAQRVSSTDDPRLGVIVGESGLIHAATCYSPGQGAAYVTSGQHRHCEASLAADRIARTSGERVIHVAFAQVALGSGPQAFHRVVPA